MTPRYPHRSHHASRILTPPPAPPPARTCLRHRRLTGPCDCASCAWYASVWARSAAILGRDS